MALTLLLNATTIKPLLRLLGMTAVSEARRGTLTSAVRHIRQTANNAVAILKEDRFLCGANWEMVEEGSFIKDPFKTENVEVNVCVVL